jgi:hypothetical protein
MISGKKVTVVFFIAIWSFFSIRYCFAQQNDISSNTNLVDTILSTPELAGNWLAFSPFTITTLFTPYNWYYFEYGHRIDLKDAFIVAIDFGSSGSTVHFPDFWNTIPYPGHTDNISVVLGYRRYIWEGLHIELDLLSGANSYYDTDNSFLSRGWSGLGAEIRIGYELDFDIFKIPLLLTIQAQLTTEIINGLYEPENFKNIGSQTSPILFFPACQFGFRF